jgi:hypothetical protein
LSAVGATGAITVQSDGEAVVDPAAWSGVIEDDPRR